MKDPKHTAKHKAIADGPVKEAIKALVALCMEHEVNVVVAVEAGCGVVNGVVCAFAQPSPQWGAVASLADVVMNQPNAHVEVEHGEGEPPPRPVATPPARKPKPPKESN